jgi:hypothetical protein
MWLSLALERYRDREVTSSRDRVAALFTPMDLERAKTQAARCTASNFKDCGEPKP